MGADSRDLAYFRMGAPVPFARSSADPRDLAHFRIAEITMALAPSGPPQTVTAAGAIASLEAFGTTVIAGPIASVGAIGSAEAFGSLGLLSTFPITAAGAITSLEAFGSPLLHTEISLTPVGIGSEERFGTTEPSDLRHMRRGEPVRSIEGPNAVGLDHFRSGVAFLAISLRRRSGTTMSLSAVAFITGVGAIASAEGFGVARLVGPIFAVGGIASGEEFGLPLLGQAAPRTVRVTATITPKRVVTGLVGT